MHVPDHIPANIELAEGYRLVADGLESSLDLADDDLRENVARVIEGLRDLASSVTLEDHQGEQPVTTTCPTWCREHPVDDNDPDGQMHWSAADTVGVFTGRIGWYDGDGAAPTITFQTDALDMREEGITAPMARDLAALLTKLVTVIELEGQDVNKRSD